MLVACLSLLKQRLSCCAAAAKYSLPCFAPAGVPGYFCVGTCPVVLVLYWPSEVTISGAMDDVHCVGL